MHVVIDSSEIVSIWNLSIPAASTALSLFVLRAEAKTRQPAEWKAGAKAEPSPPSEQPVIKTVRFVEDMVSMK